MSLATRSLEGKSHLMEEPLALSHTKRNRIIFCQMVTQQQAVPDILVVAQFPGRTLYFVAQLLLLGGRKATGTTRTLLFPKSGQTLGKKPVNPIFNGSGGVSKKLCRLVGTCTLEDIQDNVQSMKIGVGWI